MGTRIGPCASLPPSAPTPRGRPVVAVPAWSVRRHRRPVPCGRAGWASGTTRPWPAPDRGPPRRSSVPRSAGRTARPRRHRRRQPPSRDAAVIVATRRRRRASSGAAHTNAGGASAVAAPHSFRRARPCRSSRGWSAAGTVAWEAGPSPELSATVEEVAKSGRRNRSRPTAAARSAAATFHGRPGSDVPRRSVAVPGMSARLPGTGLPGTTWADIEDRVISPTVAPTRPAQGAYLFATPAFATPARPVAAPSSAPRAAQACDAAGPSPAGCPSSGSPGPQGGCAGRPRDLPHRRECPRGGPASRLRRTGLRSPG